MDLSGKYKFRAALTDGGICQVLNGNSMDATFTSSARADEFKNSLDERTEEVIPEMIHGTGQLFRKTFWLDVGERYDVHSHYLAYVMFSILQQMNV